ncbi:MAG: ribonuclease H family protein [Saprospiraceae bacterium]|nr:ribonuclease H family protein [Saprospiraceae bacterium]
MKKDKAKFYVVWEGEQPGIYTSWSECQRQIKGYPGAKYKSFESLKDAQEAYLNGPSTSNVSSKKTKTVSEKWQDHVPVGSIAVDAACEGNPGPVEYRGVDPYSGKVLFHQGPFNNGTNNIGEFLALVHALALLHQKKDNTTKIYSDSATAISWLKQKKAKTQLDFNSSNQVLYELVKRATLWLHQNSYQNQVIKWETQKWGEIPADFGRK